MSTAVQPTGVPADSGLDAPVEDPSGDLLDMDQQARALADYIRRNTAQLPFTLGIIGEWGEGKTTYVKFLKHHLERLAAPQPVKFVWFSAWPYNTTEKLWRALVLEIARELLSPKQEADAGGKAGGGEKKKGGEEKSDRPDEGLIERVSRFLSNDAVVLRKPPPKQDTKYEKVVRRLEGTDYGQVSHRGADADAEGDATMAKFVELAMGALGTVSPLFAPLRGIFGGAPKDKAAELLKQKNQAAHAQVTALTDFQEIFDDIIKEGAGDGTVYVFIDDLDRAQPDVAFDIMESIRLALWNTRCVFIVAVDERLISQGLRLRYKELFADEPGSFDEKGREYLEKIIQFRLRVPPRTPEQVQRFIAAEYPEWVAAGDIIQLAVGTNPRRLKQYCQRLTFQELVGPRAFAPGRRVVAPAPANPQQEPTEEEPEEEEMPKEPLSPELQELRDAIVNFNEAYRDDVFRGLGVMESKDLEGTTIVGKVEYLIRKSIEEGALPQLKKLVAEMQQRRSA